MRRWLLVLILCVFLVSPAYAGPSFSGGGGGTGSEVTIDASAFTGNLSVTDTDLQTALDTIDAVALGGDTTETNQDDAWAAVGGSGTESGIDVTYVDATDDVDFVVDVTPSSGSATLEIAEDAVQVKYDATLTESASGLGIAADAISEAYIADDGIDSEHYNDASIDAAHLAADVIDETKIADDGIDSEHYNDASIDAAHLAADVIDETKIADDGIDSEHYNADSIDNEHINWTDIDNLGDEGAIVAADESADTTTFVGFFTDATGSAAKTGTNLTFNSSTGALTATSFAGDLTGDVTGNTSGTAATVTGATEASITTLANVVTVGALTSGSLAAGFTDVPVAQGGTGASTLADGGLVIGNATGAVEVVGAGLTTQILVGGGASTAPVWGTDIPTAVTIGTAYVYRVGGTDVADADVADDITASSYLPLAGGTLTAEVTVDDLGLQFTEGDAISDCSSFSATGGGIFYDDSDGKFKKCQDNVLSDMDTDTGGAPALSAVTAPTAAWSIAFDDEEKVTWTTAQNTAGSFALIDNSVADVTGNVYLLELQHTDTADVDADFLKIVDGAGTLLTIQEGGMLSIGADPGDGGIFNLANAAVISWEDATETTLTHVDNTGLAVNLNIEAATMTEGGVAVLNNDEIDASSELLAIMDDETGTGVLVFGTAPTFTTSISIGSDPADQGVIRLDNATIIAWEDATETTLTHVDNTGLAINTNLEAATITEGGIAVHNNDQMDASSELLAIIDDETGTGVIVFGTAPTFTTSITITGADADPAAAGEIRYDNTITGIMSGGGLRWYDDDSVRLIVDLETDPSDNGYVVAYNSTNDGFEMVAAGTGDVLSVGNCTAGACLDGTSDGGTTISLYDGDTHKLTIDAADLTGDATLVIGSDTNNITLVNGTASIDIAAAATLNIDTGLQTTTNAGVLAFSAASKTLTVEDSATVSQDMTSDATPTFGGLTLANAGVITFTDAAATTITHVDNTGLVINLELEVDGTFDADGQLELGDGGDTVDINSSDWNIGTTGTITGVAFDVDGTGNTLTNIANANVKAGAGIDASKLADGSISDTELQYLDGLAADLATSLVTGTLQVTTLLNVDEDVDIDFNAADEEVNITNSAEYGADGAQVTIANTDADVGAAMYLLRLRYTDDGQANADFMVMEDNNGDDMITFTDGGQVQAVTLTDGTAIITGGAISAVTTIASGAITSTGLISSSAAAPSLATSDSDDAAGTGSLTFASANTQDVIGSIYVDVAGSATEYVQIDGVNESVDFLKPVNGTDATFTGTTTVTTLTQASTASPTWTTNDSTASADGTFDIRVNAATANYAGVMNIYVEEGNGAGADGSETEKIFLTVNGSGASSTSSGTIEFERISNFEMGITSSNGTTGPGFIRLYEDEDSANDYYTEIKMQTITEGGNIDFILPPDEGDNTNILATDGAGSTYWTSAGAATAWNNIVNSGGNKSMDHTGYWTTMDFGDTDSDMFTIWATEAFGNFSVVRIEQKTGNPTDGELLSLAVADAEDNVDQLAFFNGTDESALIRLVEAGSFTNTLASTDGFAQWIYSTVEDGTGATDTDGIFEIQTNTTMDADQDIFNVVKGTTTLFSVDEDGDLSFAGSLTDGTATLDGSGGWSGINTLAMTGALSGSTTITASTSIDITGAAGLILQNDETITNATDGTFLLTREDAGIVTVTSADDTVNAALTVVAGGTGKLTLGNATNTDISIVTDGLDLSETELALLDGETDLASQAELNAVSALYDTEAELEAITGALFGTSKAVTAGYMWVADGTDFESVVVSGDVTLASGGAFTIATDAVETAMINTDAVTMDAIDADGDFSTLTGDWETSGMIAGGIRQYKDGAADGEISALNDTASVGSDGDPLVLTARELMGNTITNLGAGGALYFLLPTAAIGFNAIFNMDVAQEIHLKYPAGNDEGYWKDYDDTEFALGATGKDIQCNATPTIGDRLFLQTRKVASTIEYFIWSDSNGCIIEP